MHEIIIIKALESSLGMESGYFNAGSQFHCDDDNSFSYCFFPVFMPFISARRHIRMA